MGSEAAALSHLVFWGGSYLPDDIYVDLDHIRNWALREQLVWEPESQLITRQTVDEISRFFAREDDLAVVVRLYPEPSGRLGYLEQPYVPLGILIKKGLEVKLQ